MNHTSDARESAGQSLAPRAPVSVQTGPAQRAPTSGYVPPFPTDDDGGVSTVIPFRNVPALVGYYVSIFSLIPVLGIVLGPAAVVLGVLGLKRAKANPRAKGRVHAWIAITLGGIGALITLLPTTFMAVAALSK